MVKRIVLFTLAVGLAIFPLSCTKAEKAEEMQNTALEEAVEPAEEAVPEEVIFTAEDPGPWAGKEEVHVPKIIYVRDDAGLRVTVTIAHEMDPEKPHYIEWIKLFDSDGTLLGETGFKPEDEKSEAVFMLTEIPARLVALEKCNLHGTWKAEVEVNFL